MPSKLTGGLPLTATRVGDWSQLYRVANKLQAFTPKVGVALLAEARDMHARVKRRIRQQAYDDWPPLSAEWAAYKRQHNMDRRKLIGFGDYLDSIRVLPAGPNRWMVGVPKTAKNREGRSLAAIGYVHEYGHGSVPPRPFWRFEYDESRDNLRRVLTALALETIL